MIAAELATPTGGFRPDYTVDPIGAAVFLLYIPTGKSYRLTDTLSGDGKFLRGDYGITVFGAEKTDASGQLDYLSGFNMMDRQGDFTGHSNVVFEEGFMGWANWWV